MFLEHWGAASRLAAGRPSAAPRMGSTLGLSRRVARVFRFVSGESSVADVLCGQQRVVLARRLRRVGWGFWI